MAASSTTPKNMNQIDISQLNIQQLSQLKQQFEQDINVYHELWQALKVAHTKFVDSAETIEKLEPSKDVLVPLTGSMYVPGHLGDINKLLIDIGAGYYAEKNLEDTKDYFKRKIEYVSKQMDNIQGLGAEKSKIRDAIVMMMEMKIQSTVQQQKPSTS